MERLRDLQRWTTAQVYNLLSFSIQQRFISLSSLRYLKCSEKNIRACPKQSRECALHGEYEMSVTDTAYETDLAELGPAGKTIVRLAELWYSETECRAVRGRHGIKYCPHGRIRANGSFYSFLCPVRVCQYVTAYCRVQWRI